MWVERSGSAHLGKSHLPSQKSSVISCFCHPWPLLLMGKQQQVGSSKWPAGREGKADGEQEAPSVPINKGFFHGCVGGPVGGMSHNLGRGYLEKSQGEVSTRMTIWRGRQEMNYSLTDHSKQSAVKSTGFRSQGL